MKCAQAHSLQEHLRGATFACSIAVTSRSSLTAWLLIWSCAFALASSARSMTVCEPSVPSAAACERTVRVQVPPPRTNRAEQQLLGAIGRPVTRLALRTGHLCTWPSRDLRGFSVVVAVVPGGAPAPRAFGSRPPR